jgi:cytochrome P450
LAWLGTTGQFQRAVSAEGKMGKMSTLPKKNGIRSLSELPSPRGLPLIGNALQMDLPRLHLIFEEWAREFGSVFTIGLGTKRVFVCSDADLLQTALRERPERYRRFSPIESVLEEMKSNGVFSIEGERWRPQRRLVMRALASRNFGSFFPSLKAITERLHKKWLHAAETRQAIDMARDLVRFTVDATTALAFGEDPNTIEESGDVIQEHLAEVFPTMMKRVNAPVPLWRYFKLPSDRKFDRSLDAIHRHVEALIERTRKHMREQPSDPPRNLLEAMLFAAGMPDSEITDEVIVANVMTLLLAGEDTTAHSLAWTMYFISQDARLQSKLQLAALEALGSWRICPTLDDTKKLDFFEFVTQEASRFKPVVPLMYLEPVVDVVLGDVALPSGTPLFFLLRPSMLDAKHFGRPDEFLPERWSTGHLEVEPHDSKAYAQFGAGPRVCPGRYLAAVEMRLVLSMLARNFSMKLAVSPETIKEVAAFTMMPNTMPMHLTSLH